MANKVKAIILTGNGTNCEMEMAHACKLAGADRYDIVHISELLYDEKRLSDYNFLNLPGGFLDGDDLGSAKAGANRFLHAPMIYLSKNCSNSSARAALFWASATAFS